MVQEDQIQMSNNTNGGGSRSISKKLKHKRMPQRGLGVAQLERIRIEEQQKKDASNTTSFSSPSTTLSPTHSSSIPLASFHSYAHKNPSKPSHSYHPSSLPLNLSSSNLIFKTPSASNFDDIHLGSVPITNPTNDKVFDIAWPLVPTYGNHVNVSLPLLWHPHELNLQQKGENSKLDNHGLSFLLSSSLPYENCLIGSLSDMVPRAQHYQQSSSLTNVSSTSSSSSSSVLNFPMEPPSSQSYYNNYFPFWLDEEKVKLTHTSTRPISGTNESTSCGHGGITSNFEPAIPIFREVPSCPSVTLEPTITKKDNGSQNGNLNGKFLTLAPPAIALHYPNSRFQQSSIALASQDREVYNFESLPSQETIEDLVVERGQDRSSQQPKLFSLFPTTKKQVALASSPTRCHSCNSDVGETIDLNLRL